MANNKRKKHCRNNHRHVYISRKIPHNYKTLAKRVTPLETKGSRIINLDKLQHYMDTLSAHAKNCKGHVILSGEIKHGLASILNAECTLCSCSITFETSRKVKGPRNYSQWECNLAAVWGEMMTGGGHSRLQEMLGVVGVPVMRKNAFITTLLKMGSYSTPLVGCFWTPLCVKVQHNTLGCVGTQRGVLDTSYEGFPLLCTYRVLYNTSKWI